jgi:capsular polysaccharide biosynthesis protein
VAEEVIQKRSLRVGPLEFLEDRLTVEPVEDTPFLRVSYTDTDPARATQVVNTVGRVSSERISEADATANKITAIVYAKARVPDAPASPKPLRNGLIALVAALAISSAALVAARRRPWGRRVFSG